MAEKDKEVSVQERYKQEFSRYKKQVEEKSKNEDKKKAA
jgi:hypothetical protein